VAVLDEDFHLAACALAQMHDSRLRGNDSVGAVSRYSDKNFHKRVMTGAITQKGGESLLAWFDLRQKRNNQKKTVRFHVQ
jgi:hypothetical protein